MCDTYLSKLLTLVVPLSTMRRTSPVRLPKCHRSDKLQQTKETISSSEEEEGNNQK